MKVVIWGETVWFSCASCGCVFRVGIKSAETQDNGENYYAECPLCGTSCHADANSRDSNKPKNERMTT